MLLSPIQKEQREACWKLQKSWIMMMKTCNIGVSCDAAVTVLSVDTFKCLDYKVCCVYIMGEPKGHRYIQEVCKCNPWLEWVLD